MRRFGDKYELKKLNSFRSQKILMVPMFINPIRFHIGTIRIDDEFCRMVWVISVRLKPSSPYNGNATLTGKKLLEELLSIY
jgi:hypothetical protein